MNHQKITPNDLFEMMRQFQPACVLGAAAELDLFTPLARQPMDGARLAQHLHTNPRATAILLDALVALHLLDKQENRYQVPPSLKSYLTEESNDSILPGLRHLANCQRRWGQLARVVHESGPARVEPSIRGETGDLASFIGAMQNFTTPVIKDVVALVNLPPCCHLLDIGGASGNWTAGFLRFYPEAHATLFDLPEVIPIAHRYLTSLGLMPRVTLVGGNYHTDTLPGGADVTWLSAIAHQNSRAENRLLFTKIYAALKAGGILLIRDIVLDETRTAPVAGALFAVNMLVATEGGNSYTLAEYREDLEQAGFADITLAHRDEGMNALIQASRR
jgi:hypothetical protein